MFMRSVTIIVLYVMIGCKWWPWHLSLAWGIVVWKSGGEWFLGLGLRGVGCLSSEIECQMARGHGSYLSFVVLVGR